MTKQTHLTLRLTEAEANRIAADAQTAGVSVSAWVRQAVQERVQLSQLAADLARDLVAELRTDLQARDEARDAGLATKLKIMSDQVAALSLLVAKENRK